MSVEKIEVIRRLLEDVTEEKTKLENALRTALLEVTHTEEDVMTYLWQYINVGNDSEFDTDFSSLSSLHTELNIISPSGDMVDEVAVSNFCKNVFEIVESEDMGTHMRFILRKKSDCCENYDEDENENENDEEEYE